MPIHIYNTAKILNLPNIGFNDVHPGLIEVQQYLRRYGYLPDTALTESNRLDANIANALASFQRFFGIAVTGILDEATRAAMSLPRCGLPDTAFAGAASLDGRPTTGRWDRRNLTYAFGNSISQPVAAAQVQAAITRAFTTWANSGAGLSFGQVSADMEEPDILIEWRPSRDQDQDMAGNIIAHADFPPGYTVVVNGRPLPIHFDETEHQWRVLPATGLRRLALRASNGQFVCAEDGGGREVVANRNGIGPWEIFVETDLGGGDVALRAQNGQFVCAEGGGGREVVANRDIRGPWEAFGVTDLGSGNIALRASNGQFVCAEGGGGGEVVANRDVIGPWETFALLPQPALIMDIESVALHEIGHCLGLLHVNIPGAIMFPSIPANTQKRGLDANDVRCIRLLYQTWVTLRANNGQYLCAEGGGGGEIVANRDEAGPWERFSVYDLGGNSVALVAHSGHYLCAEDGGGRELVVDRIAVGPWETFTLHDLGNGNIALQAANGQFVCAEGGGGGEVVADRDAIGPWETFERSQT